MPTYEYFCEKCGPIEVWRSMADYKVPPEHPHPVTRVISACMGFGDITPYLATAGDMAGKPITSRNEHRQFLKRNRLVELGNDPVKDTRSFRKIHKKGEMAQDLKRAIHEVRSGSR